MSRRPLTGDGLVAAFVGKDAAKQAMRQVRETRTQ